ncbi:MAG: sugar nucleotide-binding protein, partial [Candidatus Omnitrophota bacterium]
EKDRPCPLSCYGRTKREAEELIESRAGHYVIFRVSWLFGRNGPSFPRTILERAGSVPSFEVVNDQVGRPTYTRDVARALRDLFVRVSWQAAADRQIFHLGNSGEVSWADYAEMILESYPGAKPSVVKIATPLGHRPAVRPLHSVLALEKAERELGIRLRPWREAVNDFIKHELIVGQP